MSTADPFHLDRFLDAQASTYTQARAELSGGQKRSHWMWFIFPQIRGLGSSPTAQHFALSGLDEARAFLAHPVLGPRLRECTALVNAHPDLSVDRIFGYPDNLKFHSSITLFAEAAPEEAVFTEALDTFFSGRRDSATLKVLGVSPAA
jgi:uncharacterized protein (DUF1810 family)